MLKTITFRWKFFDTKTYNFVVK